MSKNTLVWPPGPNGHLVAPGVGEVTLINIGSDSSFLLPAGLDQILGPLSLFAVTPGFPPRGVWEFDSRMENPTTGALLSERINKFLIQ